MISRKSEAYKDGELEIILSLVPTQQNITHLACLLDRTEAAIQIVYKQAYEKGDFGKEATAQRKKIKLAKERLGITVGS